MEIKDLAALQTVTGENMGTRKSTGAFTIAWVIGIALVLIVIAIFWNARMSKDERLADNLFRTGTELASVKAFQQATTESVRYQGVRLDGLSKVVSSNAATLGSLVASFDDLVVVRAKPYCGDGPSCGNSGIPRYQKTSTYQECDSKLIFNDTCGQA